jgi:hypothetical protein
VNLKKYRRKDVVHATPIKFKEWRDFNKWPVIGDSDPEEDGYFLVEDQKHTTWMSKTYFEGNFDEVF